jgi:hypothetical protein
MQKNSLSSHSRESLLDALRVLKSYVVASKQIGKRAHLSDPKHPSTPPVVIEYSPHSDVVFVKDFSEKVMKQFFEEANDLPREFKENAHLAGGIRLFLSDDMVDISFDRFAHLMK